MNNSANTFSLYYLKNSCCLHFSHESPSFFLWFISAAKAAVDWNAYVLISRFQPLLLLLPLSSAFGHSSSSSKFKHLRVTAAGHLTLHIERKLTPTKYMALVAMALGTNLIMTTWIYKAQGTKCSYLHHPYRRRGLNPHRATPHCQDTPRALWKMGWAQYFPKFPGEEYHLVLVKNSKSWTLNRPTKYLGLGKGPGNLCLNMIVITR